MIAAALIAVALAAPTSSPGIPIPCVTTAARVCEGPWTTLDNCWPGAIYCPAFGDPPDATVHR